jgi:hypothetical protein
MKEKKASQRSSAFLRYPETGPDIVSSCSGKQAVILRP